MIYKEYIRYILLYIIILGLIFSFTLRDNIFTIYFASGAIVSFLLFIKTEYVLTTIENGDKIIFKLALNNVINLMVYGLLMYSTLLVNDIYVIAVVVGILGLKISIYVKQLFRKE